MFFFKKKKSKPPSLREEYIGWVITYCDEYAEFCRMKEKLDDGEIMQETDYFKLQDILTRLSIATERLTQAKEAYDVKTGMMFLEDNAFKGFSIENGQLVGDPKEAYHIASPWLYSFLNGSDENYYRFEVANLVISLANMRYAVT